MLLGFYIAPLIFIITSISFVLYFINGIFQVAKSCQSHIDSFIDLFWGCTHLFRAVSALGLAVTTGLMLFATIENPFQLCAAFVAFFQITEMSLSKL